MARLSKENLADRGRYRFTQEEVVVPIEGDDGKDGSVLVRSPSVKQRDEVSRMTPDKAEDWTIDHTALVFVSCVVDPKLTQKEAAEFLGDWPGEALDLINTKFNEMIGVDTEEMKRLAGEFRSED